MPKGKKPSLQDVLDEVRANQERIRGHGLNVTIRDTRGREADAACGQLRARAMKAEPAPAEDGLQ